MATEYAKKVAEELIDQLHRGTAPWQRPWQPGERFLPYNPTTGKDYRGGNVIWLMAQGRSDPRWMTYRQADAEGAQVRKGEHGTQIQYWITRGTEPVTDEQGKPVRDESGKPVTRTVEYERPRVKTFTVFNAEQIDGLAPMPVRAVEEWQRHERAEAIMQGSGARIEHQAGNRAFYQPANDRIVLPERGQFPSADNFYATALHELGHWTGAPDRLNRDLAHPFGSEGYAREELRAEIGSLMLGTEIGIGHDPSRHASYVASWIKALENDPQEIFRAASDAEKITAMLRGFELEAEQERPLSGRELIEIARNSVWGIQANVELEGESNVRTEDEARRIAEQDIGDAWANPEARAILAARGQSPEGMKADLEAGRYSDLAGALDPQDQARDRAAEPAQSAGSETVTVRAPILVREEHPIMQTSTDRTYLAVPYAEKDQAKALGAKWDREAKAWFAPAGTNLEPLSAWLPPREALHIEPTLDPRQEFGEAIRLAGLKLDGAPEMDGKLYRVQVVGDTGQQRSGAYVGHLDGHPAGYIQNFKAGTQQNWKSGAPMQALGAQDRARLTAEAAQKSHDRAIQRESAAQAAALTAIAAWDAAAPAPADHPYILAKQIEPGELRVGSAGQTIPYTDKNGVPREANLEGRLIVPLRDIEGRMMNIQTIDPDGTKNFHKDGRVEGMHTIVGGQLGPDSPIIIAEGYATASTVSRATNLPVIAAFNAGNIAPVAQLYRDRYPERSVIIAGDNDHSKNADQNVGRRKSEEAAVSVAGYTMLPDFAPNDRGTDWNDYAQSHGLDSTGQAISSAMRSIEAKQMAAEASYLRQEQDQEAKAHELVEERQQQAHEDEQVEIELVERQQEAEQEREQEQSFSLGR